MKLQSMVDFVLNLKLDYGTVFSETVFDYAVFLKKPLELWMFVPCGENGEVLEEKMIFANQDKDYVFEPLEFDQYQKAKSKVLFEGFEMTPIFQDKDKVITYRGIINVYWWRCEYQEWKLSNGLKTIEDLVKYNLELTPTATKQFE